MTDTDYTLTSPLSRLSDNASALLGLTVVWHPDSQRIGEQFIASNPDGLVEVSRFLPLFRHPAKEGLALGYGGISRDPVRITRDGNDGIVITPPASRMVVEVNGTEITAPVALSREQIEAGVILGLGRAILICLHWMRCLPKHNPAHGFVGVGSAAIVARDQIRQVAGTELPVLLLGETGTGKEIAARAIHAYSKRANAQLVSVNMAALNEALAAADLFGAVKGAYTGAQNARKGLFAEAEGATLFLDEIGNTPASIQPMLLRVLESGDYRPLGAQNDQKSSARLIAATDQDLYSEGFNQALLRRLESFIIHLPPLRARREDIGVLLLHLLSTSKMPNDLGTNLPVALVSEFANYDWPGNIRQLSHVLRRALLALQLGEVPQLASLVKTTHKPASAGAEQATITADSKIPLPVVPRKKLTELGEDDVLRAMENNDWYIQGAAQELGISRPSMYKLLDSHSQIRRAEQIPMEEIRQTLETSAGDIEACAALLKTPSEALRRYLKVVGG
ncbi:sigma-54-dependent Fis family transcriptional regulator [Undibacterium sp. CY18W]|uniref:Sigma-54-dependent Fis family transcriptional regulator n=1 Tax=Undibacterium hunanense TaxID=2762292 RepID=A0ABR6ZMR7_9BURK|nr:sigma 54-interacting transcriptional regulator [Undibacterium hunanense]MBC3916853.1 sigma-54-dependent Fis family transcriptional regulator [Undibacterium hunanense]